MQFQNVLIPLARSDLMIGFAAPRHASVSTRATLTDLPEHMSPGPSQRAPRAAFSTMSSRSMVRMKRSRPSDPTIIWGTATNSRIAERTERPSCRSEVLTSSQSFAIKTSAPLRVTAARIQRLRRAAIGWDYPEMRRKCRVVR